MMPPDLRYICIVTRKWIFVYSDLAFFSILYNIFFTPCDKTPQPANGAPLSSISQMRTDFPGFSAITSVISGILRRNSPFALLFRCGQVPAPLKSDFRIYAILYFNSFILCALFVNITPVLQSLLQCIGNGVECTIRFHPPYFAIKIRCKFVLHLGIAQFFHS